MKNLPRTPTPRSVDGLIRSSKADAEINHVCRRALNTRDGEMVMDYLRSITTSVVLDADASDAALRMQEGMRRVFAILDVRRKTNPTE